MTSTESSPDGPAVLAEVLAWRTQGEGLRTKLMEKRTELLRQLKEIDDALVMFTPPPIMHPSPAPPPSAPLPAEPEEKAVPAFSARHLKGMSMPVIVRRIVEAHPSGIGAKAVTGIVRQIVPKVDPALVHSGLHRGIESGVLRSEGSRGARVYFPVERGALDGSSDIEPKEDTV